MRKGQYEQGAPYGSFRDTKSNIEALSGMIGGETAHATDTGENGYYDEVQSKWIWGGGSGASVVFSSVRSWMGI